MNLFRPDDQFKAKTKRIRRMRLRRSADPRCLIIDEVIEQKVLPLRYTTTA